ncbi:hypothetical protein D9611_012215 [Ephemerocybe angulata]|uniref:C2H2-type domain-containing protein n=1 Tax=Ephemerocybe angulata TaxID=980116 RepID=A0A8H5C6M6_9AGAR|nr:hypothetical protein D9611_012215 [Tulosesus angulatus]
MNYKNITPKNALPPLRPQTREEASQVTLPPFAKQFQPHSHMNKKENTLPPIRLQTREEVSQVTLPPFAKQFPGYPTTSPPEAQPPRKTNLASTTPAVRIIQYVPEAQKRPRKNNLASMIPAVKIKKCMQGCDEVFTDNRTYMEHWVRVHLGPEELRRCGSDLCSWTGIFLQDKIDHDAVCPHVVRPTKRGGRPT